MQETKGRESWSRQGKPSNRDADGSRKRREGRKGDWLGGACGSGRCSSRKAVGEMLRVADGGVPRWSEMACPCSDWLGTAQGEQDLGPNAAVA